MIELSDADILARLTNTEDSTVERKTANDYRDCLKTAVAFSNSLPVNDPGIIFVGVGNDGTPQDMLNLDSLQKDVSKELAKIYPPIPPQIKVLRKDDKEFLAVIVRGSENRPHFAGQSYVRDGSQTLPASKQQFERLVAERNSKIRYLLNWVGKTVTCAVAVKATTHSKGVKEVTEEYYRLPAVIVSCNQFFLTVDVKGKDWPGLNSHPLEKVIISYDNTNDCPDLTFVEDY